MELPPQSLPPELIFQMLWRKTKAIEAETAPKISLTEKSRHLNLACRLSSSLPVLAIYTRDRIEAEIKGRQKARENYIEYVDAVRVSPGPLDS
jgi:hypothetical protein